MQQNKLNIAMFGHKHMLSREGGVEIVVRELATRMARYGHNVVCYDRKANHISGNVLEQISEHQGVQIKSVWTIDKRGMAAMTSSFSAACLAACSNADVVHIHAEGPAAMCLLPKLRGKRVIVTIHGLDWQRAKWGKFASKYIKWGEIQAVRHADEIIVLSHRVQSYFQSTYNRSTVYIPNGVNRPQKTAANEIIKKWGLYKDSYVLFLGRVVPEKGIRYLIEAWRSVHTDKKLVIAGGSSDTQAYLNELKCIAGNNVIFTGFQQGQILSELYSNAYLYCLPSDLEGMPLSLLEAMSYGNCCIVSDISECKEVVAEKALIFPKGNVAALSSILQKALDHPGLVQKFRDSAADYICGKYNWDDVTLKTLSCYRG